MQFNQHYSIETIQRICSEVAAGQYPQKLIAEMNGIPPSTVSSWIVAYHTNGDHVPARKPRVGKPPKLSPEDDAALKAWLDEDPMLPIHALRRKLLEQRGVDVCDETVRKHTLGFFYTLKRVYFTHVNADRPATVEQRITYATWYTEHELGDSIKKLLFLDETGFKIEMRTHYGRSPIGTIVRLRVPCIKSKNHTAMCALGYESVPHYKLLEGSGNTGNMVLFLNELFNKLPEHGYTLIMDNVKFHHSAEVLALITARGHFYKFLPPYSPFLDGIEYFFNEWKHIVKVRRPTSEVELITAIAEINHLVQPEHCRNYFKHIHHNCLKIIAGEDVKNLN